MAKMELFTPYGSLRRSKDSDLCETHTKYFYFVHILVDEVFVKLRSPVQLVMNLCFLQVSHGRLATARKPERQVTRMVVVMIVAFMVGWTPYAAFSILVTAHPTIELDPRLASIPAFFSKTAAVYNPIIYVFMNKQVTESLHVAKEHWLQQCRGEQQQRRAAALRCFFYCCWVLACLSIMHGV